MVKLSDIEINFSNACLASCIICSRPHGVGNSPFMTPDTFAALNDNLRDFQVNTLQTSGNGETFLNQHYIDYLRILKRDHPEKPRWIYNNFSLFDKEKADIIINEKLLDRVTVRIDSLEKWIFERNSNLNYETVFENVKYFLSKNTEIPFVILYNNITRYYKRCFEVLYDRPTRDYFTSDELLKIKDEGIAILDYFKPYAKCEIGLSNMSHCLWGERTRAIKDTVRPCPKIEVIEKVVWILPNGDVTCCCYDDRQDAFIAGNINKERLADIVNGQKRRDIIENIRNRKYTEYPCINPRCCGFNDGVEAKE